MSEPGRAKPADILRIGGRLALVAVVACALGLVALQFQGIVVKNVAVAREITGARADVRALRERKARQLRTIDRLNNAAGAIPEIHEKLRLVGKHEEIIYLRGSFGTAASPDDDGLAH